MSERVRTVGDSSFEKEVLLSNTPVLVDFSADWCAPCRMMAPIIEAVAEDNAGNARILKLDVDGNPATSQRYGIKGIPTLILFDKGEEVERIVGATSKESISRMLEKYLSLAAV